MLQKKVGNIVFSAFTNCIWYLPRKTKTLYLTFDDGPFPKGTIKILDILETYQVPAIFFLSGEKIFKYRQDLQKLNYNGHKLGNHGYKHYPMIYRTLQIMQKEIQLTDELIETYFKESGSLFRPPFGIFGNNLEKLLKYLGKDMVLWSLMSNDFKWNSSKVFTQLCKKVDSGDIIVFHDSDKSYPTTLEVLPNFLEFCIEKGFQFSII